MAVPLSNNTGSMLHHANVDCIWAYWQALRPQLGSMSQYYRGGSRFATQGGTIITPQSPLPPFRQSESAFHTPESIVSIETLGYSYPALGGSKTAQQTRDDVSRLINSLYGPRNGRPRSLGRRDDTVTRYFAKISVDVTELERPCSIDVVVNGTHAGSMTVMTQPSEGVIHGEVPLDAALESSHANQLAVNDAGKSVQTAVNVEITKASQMIPCSPVLDNVFLLLTAVNRPTEHTSPRQTCPAWMSRWSTFKWPCRIQILNCLSLPIPGCKPFRRAESQMFRTRPPRNEGNRRSGFYAELKGVCSSFS